jgi:hypothetical protein
MLRLMHPLFGDLMFDGAGLLGCVFVLVLMWDAWKDWKQARVRRDRRGSRLPYAAGRRRPARRFFRKSRAGLVLLVIASGVTAMLVGGRQSPHGARTSPTTPAGTLNPAAGNLSSGKDSNRVGESILTYQTLPPPRGAGASVANGNSNAIASPLRKQPNRN